MSSVVRRGNSCQPQKRLHNEYADAARAGGPQPCGEGEPAPGRDDGAGPDLPTGNRGRVYRIDWTRTCKKPELADTLESWIQAAKEIFSTPSEKKGVEKVSVCALDEVHAESSRASSVPETAGPARRLPGVDAPSGEPDSTTLLDYRLTQGEKEEESFKDVWRRHVSTTIDAYRVKAVVAGHVIKVNTYHRPQICQKGRSCQDRQKREDRTEEDKERDRKRNLWRARNVLTDTINANVDEPWGERLKFFTMTQDDEHALFDLKTSNYEFNKFIKRLEYQIRRKLHYTVIARFQDGSRPGGKVGGRDGVIHYHVLFYDLPYTPHEKLTKIWGRGFVWINAVDDVDNVGIYMVKGYMEKEMDDARLNREKHYWSSRGLAESRILYGNETLLTKLGIRDREPVYEKTITSDYVGIYDYKQYNLKREGKVYERKKKSGSSGNRGTSAGDDGGSRAGVDLVSPLREGVSPGRDTVGLRE